MLSYIIIELGSTLSNVSIDLEENASNSIGINPNALPKSLSSDGVSLDYAKDPNKKWYILRASYGREHKAYDYIIAHGSVAYIPIQQKENEDGITVWRSLLPNIVFVYETDEQIANYVRGPKRLHYLNFYYNRLKKDNTCKDTKATISTTEMDNFIRITNIQNPHIKILDNQNLRLKKHDIVKINEGQFRGIFGKVIRIMGQQRVAVTIDGLCSIVTAYIPSSFLEIVQTKNIAYDNN